MIKPHSVLILLLALLFVPVTPLLPVHPAVAADQVQHRPLRILMIVNEGFWAPEYYLPRQLFEKQGYQITVAGKTAGVFHPDARNTASGPVTATLSFQQVRLADFDAITFAGGNGAWTDYFPNDAAHRLLTEALEHNMVTGLLCASTGLLGMANNYNGQAAVPLARGRHVTGYFRVEGILRQLGQVNYDPGDPKQPYAVIDKNLITGRDPESATVFGEAVIQVLKARFGKS